MWNELSFRQREIVAHDADHQTETYQRFDSSVKAEAERLFNDENYRYNDPIHLRHLKRAKK